MRFRRLVMYGALLGWTPLAGRADSFQLTGPVFPRPGATPIILQISTSGPAPSPVDESRYRTGTGWKVAWRGTESDVPTYPDVAAVELDRRTQHVLLHLTGSLPAGDGRLQFWTVLFDPPRSMAAIPTLLSYAPRQAAGKPSFLSPIGSADQPDILLNGTFLAGGNTKPIYTLQEQANLYSTGWGSVLGFVPGFTSAVAINQGAQPPNNRTRFDPDSIQAGISFWRVDPLNRGALYGLTTRVDLVTGEFARSDPSSSIVSGFLSTFVLRRKRLTDSAFAALYPVIGLEAGHNLNHPDQLMGAPIDLSHSGGIVRGVLGSDATLGVAASDRTANIFAISASYRVRLPAIDEPFVESLHGQTTATLTTKARHWLQVNVTYSPPQWKYLGLTAKYQYGSLPPVFSLVDHQVSFGFLLQAKQTNKPSLPTQ